MIDFAGTKSETFNEVEARHGDWSLQHDRFMLQVGTVCNNLKIADTFAGDGGSI